LVNISRGAGAEPLPEREVTFANISRGAGAEPLPEREVSSQIPFFFRFAPHAAQNEN